MNLDPLNMLSLASSCAIVITSIGIAIRLARSKPPTPEIHTNHHQPEPEPDMRVEMMRRLQTELGRSYAPKHRINK